MGYGHTASHFIQTQKTVGVCVMTKDICLMFRACYSFPCLDQNKLETDLLCIVDMSGSAPKGGAQGNWSSPYLLHSQSTASRHSTSRSGFETLMDDIVEGSGVMQGQNGKFTTHCFRRGGAQYPFMWACGSGV